MHLELALLVQTMFSHSLCSHYVLRLLRVDFPMHQSINHRSYWKIGTSIVQSCGMNIYSWLAPGGHLGTTGLNKIIPNGIHTFSVGGHHHTGLMPTADRTMRLRLCFLLLPSVHVLGQVTTRPPTLPTPAPSPGPTSQPSDHPSEIPTFLPTPDGDKHADPSDSSDEYADRNGWRFRPV